MQKILPGLVPSQQYPHKGEAVLLCLACWLPQVPASPSSAVLSAEKPFSGADLFFSSSLVWPQICSSQHSNDRSHSHQLPVLWSAGCSHQSAKMRGHWWCGQVLPVVENVLKFVIMKGNTVIKTKTKQIIGTSDYSNLSLLRNILSIWLKIGWIFLSASVQTI